MNAAGLAGSTKSAEPGKGIRRTDRRVSMGDVARLAGVSAQTVSRVSNGFPGVLEETRQQVLAA
jgi:transcriptional regulator with XRE-family HTH domain